MDYYAPMSNELADSIRKQLNVDDKAKYEHSVALFEQWVACQTYLPQDYDRILLPVIIRQCKHDMEKAKRKIRNYFIGLSKVTTIYKDRFQCLNKDCIISNYMYLAILPQTTPEGHRICFTKILNPDPAVIDMRRVMQYVTLIVESRIYGDELCSGDVYITDAVNVNGGHIATFVNNTIKQLINLALESFPVRIKAMHVITDKAIVVHGTNLFKAFLKEKLRQKLHVHKDIESLINIIPQKCLPADYGGAQKSLAEISNDMENCMRSRKDILEKIETLKLQGPIPKDVDVLTSIEFGTEGSFRKLELD